ncbi:beta family protein [Alkalicoccobacillus plakortidis]|uniref:Beta family protein n=1 Tax=Alkalicoccobacillus plakortidis TaxID=444060 RepID=A0ABT0XE30_9BACI|nr:beta family protein [Alkalicoccobacillus plakortidis]MCM2674070.1 beta family protein [Alkalicoccobacillus plakortidis]
MNENVYYAPVIRWKKGEQIALKKLNSNIKERIIPLFEIPPIDWDFEKGRPQKSIEEHLVKIPAQIKDVWSANQKFMLDLTHLCIDDDETMKSGLHPLEHVINDLTLNELPVTPVLSSKNGSNYENAIFKVVDESIRRLAIRIYPSDLKRIDELITSYLNKTRLSPENIDIILDYGYIRDKEIVQITNEIAGAITIIPFLNEWNSFSLITTSIPEDLSEIKTGETGTLNRCEWTIYKSIIKRNLTRHPNFGDYNIQNPEYKQLNPKFIQQAAAIRYTTCENYLIVRGYSVRSEKHGKWKQMQGLSEQIVNHDDYSGPNYSFGDEYIYKCHLGEVGTGNAMTWRTIGTNHHLTLVIKELSNFHGFSI